jgi:hypothetical protein
MTQSTPKKTRGNTFDRAVLIPKIAMLRIESKSTYFILNFLENDIGMGRTTAYEILREAQEYILQMAQTDVNKAYEEAIQQIERKMDGCDKKMWLEYRKELNKLQALYRAQKLDVTSGGEKLEGFKIIFPDDKGN